MGKHLKNKKKPVWVPLHPLLFFTILLERVPHWMRDAVGGVTFDALVFHLKVPLEGSDISLLGSFLIKALLPAIILHVFFLFLIEYWPERLKQKHENKPESAIWPKIQRLGRIVRRMLPKIIDVCFVVELVLLLHTISLGKYIENQLHSSTWIEENYVKPAEDLLTWPEKKRNLIYIYLESMETTYMSESEGGIYPENLIPELTELVNENLSFSDKQALHGGARTTTGATWTMGAMFAQTSGLPLKIPVESNSMNEYAVFFPKVVSLGDLTRQAGYRNILMLGSYATFAGRRLYFTEHGEYELYDYTWARENRKIPEDYYVFWGFEDERLIELTKEKLLEAAQSDEPFNLTMLTVDTHFPDGYRCRLCREEHETDYKDALSCSSRQIGAFVKWIQQQDFYENTTVILCGDHLTMAAEIGKDAPAGYNRTVYNCILNPAAEPEQSDGRVFTTMDMFPTTLAALGVQIEGDRLGLGTNLFSGRPTLAEEIGYEALEENVSLHSKFMDSLAH